METLAVRVQRDGPLNELDAVGWAIRLSKRVEELHMLGVAHGGISAACVMTESASFKTEGMLSDVREATIMPAYHSPERHAGRGISPADDSWAIGVTLYLLLTGSLPFAGETAADIRKQLATTAPAPLAVFDVGDDALQRVLDQFLALAISKRVVRAATLREALEAWHPDAAINAVAPLDESEDESYIDDEDDDDAATVMRDFSEVQAAMAAAGMPTPGMPTPGMPTPGMPSPGMPTPGMPSPGMPGATPGMPRPGTPGPTPGMPTPGMPAPGMAAPGMPTPGMPTPGMPVAGAPMPGMPARGDLPPGVAAAPPQPAAGRPVLRARKATALGGGGAPSAELLAAAAAARAAVAPPPAAVAQPLGNPPPGAMGTTPMAAVAPQGPLAATPAAPGFPGGARPNAGGLLDVAPQADGPTPIMQKLPAPAPRRAPPPPPIRRPPPQALPQAVEAPVEFDIEDPDSDEGDGATLMIDTDAPDLSAAIAEALMKGPAAAAPGVAAAPADPMSPAGPPPGWPTPPPAGGAEMPAASPAAEPVAPGARPAGSVDAVLSGAYDDQAAAPAPAPIVAAPEEKGSGLKVALIIATVLLVLVVAAVVILFLRQRGIITWF